MPVLLLGVVGVVYFRNSGLRPGVADLGASKALSRASKTEAVSRPQTSDLGPRSDAGENGIYSDVDKYAEYLESLAPTRFQEELRRLISIRAGLGDFGFDKITQTWPDGAEGDPTVRLLLEKWAKVNPRDAMAAIEALADVKSAVVRYRYANVVLGAWVQIEPQAAWEWMTASLESLPPSLQSNRIPGIGTDPGGMPRVWAVYRTLADLGRFSEAGQLMSQAQATDLYSGRAAAQLERQWVGAEPTAAVAWLANLKIDSSAAVYGIMGLGAYVGELEPEISRGAASQYLRGFGTNARQEIFSMGYVTALVQAGQSAQVLEWLTSENSPELAPQLQSAITAYFSLTPADQLSDEKSAAVHVSLLTRITDPARRASVAQKYATKIRASQPNRAMAILAEFPVPASAGK